MFEKVRDMLAEALNISAEKITMDSNVIEDLGADSLDMVELLSRLEDEARNYDSRRGSRRTDHRGRYRARAGENREITV